jgi:hypothetical protein
LRPWGLYLPSTRVGVAEVKALLLAIKKGEKGQRPMRSQGQPSLPTGRAFVVQLHAEADVAKGRFKGRVEHIVSYQATHFASVDALALFMARVVAEHEAEEEEAAPGEEPT